jgi:hypothetical protein
MGSRVRQLRQQLGLASALALCALLSGAVSGSTADGMGVGPPEPEFRLARLAYGGNYNDFRGGSWQTDMPEAEYHLSQGIRRLTRINTIDPDGDPDIYNVVYPVQMIDPREPLNPRLFTHPFLYGVEVGRWYLDDEEAAQMREYLERGGFLMVDDFHGSQQWEGFMESFQRVFPDRTVVDIPEDHEVFHVLYDLNQKVHEKLQIPGVAALNSGVTYEQDGYEPHWRGVFDDNGRLMVAINFNMDLGDSWEHADTPGYPQTLTALGYRFAISYAIYAMTH